jgi:hypothetical protein
MGPTDSLTLPSTTMNTGPDRERAKTKLSFCDARFPPVSGTLPVTKDGSGWHIETAQKRIRYERPFLNRKRKRFF